LQLFNIRHHQIYPEVPVALHCMVLKLVYADITLVSLRWREDFCGQTHCCNWQPGFSLHHPLWRAQVPCL